MEFPVTKLFTISLPNGNSYQMILLHTLGRVPNESLIKKQISSEIKFLDRTKVYYCFNKREIISMWTNFTILSKPNQTPKPKFLEYLYKQLIVLITACSKLGLPSILWDKFNEAQVTQKIINLPKSFHVNYVWKYARSSFQYFIWLDLKRV